MKILTAKSSLAYYILGAFCTDGNICIDISKDAAKCSLSSMDEDWLHDLHNVIGNDGILRQRKDRRHEIWLYNMDVYNWFNENGCSPNKSFTLEFPTVPKEFLPDFIQGCIDGDGSITSSKYIKKNREYRKTTCYLCGSSLSFLKSFEKILLDRDINCSFVLKKNSPNDKIKYTQPHYRVFMNDSNVYSFLEWIYYPDHVISMPRKRKLAEEVINHYKGKY